MAKRIAVDALTRALCPSIDACLLSKFISWPLASAGHQHAASSHGTGSGGSRCASQVRATHTSSSVGAASPQRLPSSRWFRSRVNLTPKPAHRRLVPRRQAHCVAAEKPSGSSSEFTRPENGEPSESNPDATPPADGEGASSGREREAKRSITENDIIWHRNSDIPKGRVQLAETPVLYAALRGLARRRNKAGAIRYIVEHLVKERGERPNVFLYEALVVANWDTTTGSAGELGAIYKELRTAGIQPTESWYHSALRLLAIHPDYLMRTTLLQAMKEHGVELSDEGKHSVALGLLRDGQNEMALDYWDQMHKEGTDIPKWLAMTFVHVLLMRGFVDEAVELVHQKLASGEWDAMALAMPTWSSLLDECSKTLHYEGTKAVWDRMVQTGELNPPDGIVVNVLNTAARHGDTALATAAIERLAGREVKLGFHHYEPLLESYVQAGDLDDAFRVLGIMSDSGLQPDQPSTRPIYQALTRSPERIADAVEILKELVNPPVAAINVVLEAAAKTGDMARTLDVYRQICDRCRAGPNQQTFALLLDECDSTEPAVFLVQEMDRYSVRPSHPILDSLIRCFAIDGSLDVALAYLDEIGSLSASSGTWVSKRTLQAVLHRCDKEKHPKRWRLLEQAKEKGMEVGLE